MNFSNKPETKENTNYLVWNHFLGLKFILNYNMNNHAFYMNTIKSFESSFCFYSKLSFHIVLLQVRGYFLEWTASKTL